MPELPEVETVRRTLIDKVKGRRIIDVKVYWDNIIAYPQKDIFIKNVTNECINDIKRRGKFLVFVLDDYYLLSHLRMEGKYATMNKDVERSKYDHVIFLLDNGKELRYSDTRKFGKMYLIPKEDIMNIGPLRELGLEPWDDKLDSNYLTDKFKNCRLPIKSALLMQNFIVGIGNIYADEILFLCKINPLKKANLITKKEASDIIYYTRQVFDKAILMGGSTIKSYSSAPGVIGHYQDNLLVHGREGEKCPLCDTAIKRIKINGRSTYYCSKCQKL